VQQAAASAKSIPEENWVLRLGVSSFLQPPEAKVRSNGSGQGAIGAEVFIEIAVLRSTAGGSTGVGVLQPRGRVVVDTGTFGITSSRGAIFFTVFSTAGASVPFTCAHISCRAAGRCLCRILCRRIGRVLCMSRRRRRTDKFGVGENGRGQGEASSNTVHDDL
jgi:hypothetical protein